MFSVLLHQHWGNHMILVSPVMVNQAWIWVRLNRNKIQPNTRKRQLCAKFSGYILLLQIMKCNSFVLLVICLWRILRLFLLCYHIYICHILIITWIVWCIVSSSFKFRRGNNKAITSARETAHNCLYIEVLWRVFTYVNGVIRGLGNASWSIPLWAITQTNADSLSIGPLEIKISEIFIQIGNVSSVKLIAKSRLQNLGYFV